MICRPKAFEHDEPDAMVREARAPELHDWLVNYGVEKSPHAEELCLAWSADPDPVIASAGRAPTTERVTKKPESLDLAGLPDLPGLHVPVRPIWITEMVRRRHDEQEDSRSCHHLLRTST